MAQKNLQINIRIGLQQVAAAVGNLRQRFNLLRSSLRAVFRTATVAGFFAALRSGFGVLSGLQSNITKLIGQFAELNLAAAKTAAVASRGGEGFAAAFEQASNMARETSMQVAFSAGEIQQGLFTAAQAGLGLADSMKVTNSAMQLATVGAEDFQTTLNNLIGITRAFGVEINQIPQFADALTAAMVNSKATLNDLFEGLRNVASVASTAFGESRETFIDSAAALMTLNDAGIEGCFDKETEVLTKAGWKYWSDVSLSDIFATVNQQTHNLEYQKANRLFNYFYTGKMYRVKNRSIDLMVTPDHNMFVKPRGSKRFEIIPAKEIFGKSVKYLRSVSWIGSQRQTITLTGFDSKNIFKPKLTIDATLFCEFLGYYLSEGYLNNSSRDYRVVLYQNPGEKSDKIEACLRRLPFSFYKRLQKNGCNAFTIYDKRLFNYLKPLGDCYTKYIPSEILAFNSTVLSSLYRALVLGDGDSKGSIYTSSITLRDNLQELALKLGYTTNYSQPISAGDTWSICGRKGTCKANGWKVNFNWTNVQPEFYAKNYVGEHKKRYTNSPDVFEGWVHYSDRVYCADVPNATLIVRRGGKVNITGNSKAGIRLRAAMQKLMGGTAQTTAAFTKYGINLFQTNAESQKYLGTLLKGQRAFASYTDKLNELKNAQFELISSGKMFTNQYEQVDKQYRDMVSRGSEYIRNNLEQVQSLKQKRDAMLASGDAYERGSKGSFQELQEEIDSVGGSLNQLQSGLDDIYNEFTLAGGQLKPFAAILNEIKGKAPTEVIGRAFGIRGGEGIMRVLNNLDKFNRFKQILKEYVQESERGKSITQDIFGKFLDTVLIKWQRMKNSVMAIFGTIADAFFEAMGPVLEPLQMGLEAIFEMVKKNKDVFKQMFQGIADALMPIASQVAVWAAVIAEKFRDIFTPGKSVTFPIFSAENGQLKSTEKEFSGGTAQKLGGFVKSLTSLLVEGLRAGLQRLMPFFVELAKVMTDAFAGFMQAKAALWESIGITIAGAMVTGFIQAIIKELPKIRSAFNDIMEGLGFPEKGKLGKGLFSFDVPLRLPEAGASKIPESDKNANGGMLSWLDRLFSGGITESIKPVEQEKKSSSKAFVDFGQGLQEVNLDALEKGSKNMKEVFTKVEKSSEIFGAAIVEVDRKATAAVNIAESVQRQVFQLNSKGRK